RRRSVWGRLLGAEDRERAEVGFVNLQEDGDEFVRRQQLLGRDGDRLVPHLALALYARMRGQGVEPDAEGRPVVGGEVIPVDSEGKVRINYVGPPGSFEELSFARVLESARRKEPLPQLEGAAVLIGLTARDQQDSHSTP